jgi:hypothetical protein
MKQLYQMEALAGLGQVSFGLLALTLYRRLRIENLPRNLKLLKKKSKKKGERNFY